MLNYIALYPNKYSSEFNDEILIGNQDLSIADYAIMEMMELEAVENIHIESYKIIDDQSEVDINHHMVNINFKKKDMSSIEYPTNKYIHDGRFSEIIFRCRVETNLNSKIIEKHILIPEMDDAGFYYNHGKKQKAIWQIVDEATYSQRGRNTMKSRMPIIIYQNKKRVIADITGEEHTMTSYSYALNGKQRKGGPKGGKKPKAKFINPLMIYSAKMGYFNTLDFFGMTDIVRVLRSLDEIPNKDDYYIFEMDSVYLAVLRYLFDKYELVQSFVCMSLNLRSPKDFPIDYEALNDLTYWTCRIGTVGAARNKNLASFQEKGSTNMFMIERLLNEVTRYSLRLPDYYKQNIYYVMYWLITNFTELRKYSNIDMRSKRIRRNEVIVDSTLGKKISENINKLIERKSRSKLNNMDTLLELFNFPSDIIVTGMSNLDDIIKSDDVCNDMDFLMRIGFTMKGPRGTGPIYSNVYQSIM